MPSERTVLPAHKFSASTGAALLLLASVTFLVHGYHPFADDAGLYIGNVEKMLHPELFPTGMGLSLNATHVEVFYPLVAGCARLLHGNLAATLLCLYLGTVAMFASACWYLAGRFAPSRFSRWMATGLACALYSLPVAGTSIRIMEPYLGARSFVLPLALFAIGLTLARRWVLLGLTLAASAMLHPEVSIYTGSFVLVLAMLDHGRHRAAVAMVGVAVALAALLYAASLHISETAAYRISLQSRTYVFLGDWQWYELLGLVAPLALLAAAVARLRRGSPAWLLAATSLLTGASSLVCSALFVRPGSPGLLARLMMLRMFLPIYAVGVLLLGGWLAAQCDRLRKGGPWIGAAGLCAVACGMFFVQKADFGHSNHLELPGMPPRNPYEQAFLWIRSNTPPSAIFAADPMLVFAPGEDEQNFRAIAQRSVLSDYKDEGLVFIFPKSPDRWLAEMNAQIGIAAMPDAQRLAHVKPFGASWILLAASANTALPCPFRNEVVQVCRLAEQ